MQAISYMNLTEKKWRSVMITDKAVIFSSIPYISFESMTDSLVGKSALETRQEFWYHSLIEISFLENGEQLHLKRNNYKGDPISVTVDVEEEFIEALVSAMTNEETFTREEEKPSPLKVASSSLFSMAIVLGTLLYFYVIAKSLQGTEEIDDIGFIDSIITITVSILGNTGMFAIGGAILAILIYRLLKLLKDPPVFIRMRHVAK